MTVESIRIRGASLHNLRAADLDIPSNTLAFLTGPSGSGKTSLAIDTLGAEGQRRESCGGSWNQRARRKPVPRTVSSRRLAEPSFLRRFAT